jgi:electron transfer flavoprotein beta subunit
MEILVCVKRVPTVGGKISLTADAQQVDTRMSGFAISPHEECAVEEAVRLTERLGGTVTVLTLGPPEAADQVRDGMALGAGAGVLLEAEDREWGPMATADAIAWHVTRVTQRSGGYDLLLFGNEAADTGDYQVPVRVAHKLGLPCVTGIKHLEVQAGDGAHGQRIRASREYRGLAESFDVPLPAVVSVKEGINLPRYPSLPGRLRAKRAALERVSPPWHADGVRTLGLRLPDLQQQNARVLGAGTDAVPALVELLDELGVLP